MNNNTLEIDTKKIMNNINVIKKKKEICLAVKGNAYGVGNEIIEYFIDEGFDFFGVSTIQEALDIRRKSKTAKILIFSAVFPEDLEIVRENNFKITVYDLELLKSLNNSDQIHIKFDVGMGRLGFKPSAVKKVNEIIKEKKLIIEGVYTHLPSVDNEIFTEKQIEVFKNIVNQIKASTPKIPYVHIFNGLGALKYNTEFDNMVRVGLGIYGYYGNLKLKEKYNFDLKPSLKLTTKISMIKEYSGLIGYDGIDEVDGEIVTIPIGYHDGLTQGYHNYQIPGVGRIVGKVCMCQTMILLDEDNKLKKGDVIEIFNEQNIYQLSEHSKTSVYELLSTLSNRIERKLIK